MTYIKINGNLYLATINGKMSDTAWDNRASKAITLDMDYATASTLFVDGLTWSIVQQEEVPVYKLDENGGYMYDENGEFIQIDTEMKETEFDNSEYNLAGDIIDHRDGTITVKMGALTPLEEAYELLLS